jgi:galactose oxidase-like protein
MARSSSALALVLALAPSASCGPAPRDEPGSFGHELSLAPGERLLEYAWDGGPSVPSLALAGPTGTVHIPFGERGLVRTARLYLPGNSASEAASTGASLVLERGVTLGPGRLGTALWFASTSLQRFALPPSEPAAAGWTLWFWIRPESAAFGRRFLLLPDVVELELLADGRPRAHLLPSGEELLHPTVLAAGAWYRLSLAYDPAFARQMRLSIDDAAVCLRLGAVALDRTPSELHVGDLGTSGQGFVGALDDLVLEALPLSTAQVRCAVHPEGRGGTHRLDLSTSLGSRLLEPVDEPLASPVLDSSADFAAGELEGVDVADGALRWVPARWRRLETAGTPPPRTAHPTVAIGDGRTLVFGGETRDTDFGPNVNTNDTWIHERGSERWERVLTPLAPPPRCHMPLAYSPDHDLVLLVGGWMNDAKPRVSYEDTWVFRVPERRWEPRSPGGDLPGTVSDHGLVYLPALARFALFLGPSVRLYDPVADLWQLLPDPSAVTAGGEPTSYTVPGSAMCALDPVGGQVVLFGGHSGPSSTIFHDTTALYDVGANRFTVLDPPQHPSARVRSAFAYDVGNARFVLFGGVQDQRSQRHDDLWLFDPLARLWQEIPCSNRPGPLGGVFGMAYDEGAGELVLFGGRRSLTSWLDETQILTLRPALPGSALYTFDRRQSRARDWFAESTTPGDSTVSFLFRTSRGDGQWDAWSSSLALAPDDRYLQVEATLAPGSAGETPTIERMGLR